MDKARIIYITGMKPKPEPGLHRPELMRVLAASLGRESPGAADWLYERPENFVLVSWTSLLYDRPRDIALDRAGIGHLLARPFPSDEDKRESDSLRRVFRRAYHLVGDSFPWLSQYLASPTLKVTLDDVHRYLENRDGVAGRIRQLLIDALDAAWRDGDRVLLVGHSLGSVIAWDSLWQLSHEAGRDERVELFMTLGSPLATRFIRNELKGSRQSGLRQFPTNVGRWVNVAARGEMVALHRRVRPFFAGMVRRGLVSEIEDVTGIYNHFRGEFGLNPHKSYGYLNHPVVAGRILRWLGYSS